MPSAIKLILLVLSLTVVADMAFAENWVYSKSADMYFDTDSIQRSGDISVIKARVNGRITFYSIDCKRNAWLFEDKVYPIEKNGRATGPQEASAMACKKWYEFWK